MLKKCPNCGSNKVSNGKDSFIYSLMENRRLPTQYCYNCNYEWYLDKKSTQHHRRRYPERIIDIDNGILYPREGIGITLSIIGVVLLTTMVNVINNLQMGEFSKFLLQGSVVAGIVAIIIICILGIMFGGKEIKNG